MFLSSPVFDRNHDAHSGGQRPLLSWRRRKETTKCFHPDMARTVLHKFVAFLLRSFLSDTSMPHISVNVPAKFLIVNTNNWFVGFGWPNLLCVEVHILEDRTWLILSAVSVQWKGTNFCTFSMQHVLLSQLLGRDPRHCRRRMGLDDAAASQRRLRLHL